MRSGLGCAVAGFVCLTFAAGGPAQAATLTDGDTYGSWRVVFAGYGSVTATPSKSTLQPAVATTADTTHAALVVGTSQTNVRLKTRVTLNAQLRTGSSANPWKTGWLVTRYQDPEHFYYVALKTNGWELGKRDPAYPGGQRFRDWRQSGCGGGSLTTGGAHCFREQDLSPHRRRGGGHVHRHPTAVPQRSRRLLRRGRCGHVRQDQRRVARQPTSDDRDASQPQTMARAACAAGRRRERAAGNASPGQPRPRSPTRCLCKAGTAAQRSWCRFRRAPRRSDCAGPSTPVTALPATWRSRSTAGAPRRFRPSAVVR